MTQDITALQVSHLHHIGQSVSHLLLRSIGQQTPIFRFLANRDGPIQLKDVQMPAYSIFCGCDRSPGAEAAGLTSDAPSEGG
jgi:hypothetical protein